MEKGNKRKKNRSRDHFSNKLDRFKPNLSVNVSLTTEEREGEEEKRLDLWPNSESSDGNRHRSPRGMYERTYLGRLSYCKL